MAYDKKHKSHPFTAKKIATHGKVHAGKGAHSVHPSKGKFIKGIKGLEGTKPVTGMQASKSPGPGATTGAERKREKRLEGKVIG
jgi:hypothetical protein